MKLELPGADSSKHFEENRMKVLQWLKETGMSQFAFAVVQVTVLERATDHGPLLNACLARVYSPGLLSSALLTVPALDVNCHFSSHPRLPKASGGIC